MTEKEVPLDDMPGDFVAAASLKRQYEALGGQISFRAALRVTHALQQKISFILGGT